MTDNFTVTVRVTNLSLFEWFSLTGSRPNMSPTFETKTMPMNGNTTCVLSTPHLSWNWQQATTKLVVVVCLNQSSSTQAICPSAKVLDWIGPWTAAIWTSLSVSTSSPVLMLTGWLCYSCALMCEEPADSVFAEQARHQGIAAHSSLPRSECG